MYWTFLRHEPSTKTFFWWDKTPYVYETSVINDAATTDMSYFVFSTFGRFYGSSNSENARSFLCQANFDGIEW